jgi:hypothetical protein
MLGPLEEVLSEGREHLSPDGREQLMSPDSTESCAEPLGYEFKGNRLK